jgi:ribosomal protein S3
MGQKVHPLGFRVGITKKHQSQWFARFNKYKYAQSVFEDRMLRKTLTDLFPSLLNPLLKKTVKRDDDGTVTPRITQIKIERGLIPYEIGIGIYAENCELLKSAIDNLKVNQELVCKLQKARRYLLNLRTKLNKVSETESINQSKENTGENQGNQFRKNSLFENKKGFRFQTRLSKQEQRRQRLIQKRLRKRQSIRRRYRQLIMKGLFLKKTGNQIVQKLSLKGQKTKFTKKGSGEGQRTLAFTRLGNQNEKGKMNFKQGGGQRTLTLTNQPSLKTIVFKSQKRPKGYATTLGSRIKKKFVSIFLQKMNKKFLKHLKENIQLMNMNSVNSGNFYPLGYNKKWSLTRLNLLKKQPISKLQRLIRILEQKSLVKLESLRKEFIAFGSISKERSFAYYQVVNFLKHLKETVNKLKREQKLQLILNKVNKSSLFHSNESTSYGQTKRDLRLNPNSVIQQSKSFNETVLRKKLNNIDDECRKIKFIEYLKELIKKHRTNNIYLYLSTISEARKDLRKLKQFTKRHANFLFGFNLNSLKDKKTELYDKVRDRVSQVVEKTDKKSDFDKNLQDIFIEQIEKQRTMYTEKAQLTPKITLKFYSVNSKTLQAKASVVSYSIVDALEKRKAFRKVIKDAKETLMRQPGVKGVKIQVAGRLNGAEIARTEWVRAGRVPLQTLRANIDYSYKTASTLYGIIGVQVWIFKGYTKFIN